MKRWLTLFALLVAAFLVAWWFMRKTELEGSYAKVREGMRRSEVHEIMGLPQDVGRILGGGFPVKTEIWEIHTGWRHIRVEVWYDTGTDSVESKSLKIYRRYQPAIFPQKY